MRSLLGGKGANLAEMMNIGLPVPPGFTITTEACRDYFRHGYRLSDALTAQIEEAMRQLEHEKGERFGDPNRPLLVSVRSGAVVSMPGMMDTILNLGLNDETVQGLAASTNDPRFAYDCYRRLMQMFGNVVMGIDPHHFEQKITWQKRRDQIEYDQEMSADGWKSVIAAFKDVFQAEAERPFPQDVNEQLKLAIEAVFKSWHNPRARLYRSVHNIPDSQGTAVNVQCMVFGNKGSDSGTGVLFTRDPSSGENRLFGEYLVNAQGEDVVAGVRTPLALDVLRDEMPDIYAELEKVAKQLEHHYRDMQDIEFTVESGKLYLLQTRSGKRTAQAALTIAVHMVEEGLIHKEEALKRIEPSHLEQLLHTGVDECAEHEVLATGLPASPGAAVGRLVFHADTAVEWSKAGHKVVLARPETTPEDIHGVLAAEGILTSRGGMTSHAAVVARGLGKPAVCGCESIQIDVDQRQLIVGDHVLEEGAWVTLDGATGRVINGTAPLREAELTDELQQIMAWADEIRTLKVYANADTPHDAQIAKELGAEGIGLCRTEHMFFSPTRLSVMQEMILADTEEERKQALLKLLPMQQSDFEDLFRAMDGMPVTIRLLDPPLHEFLPSMEQLRQRANDPDLTEQEREQAGKLIRKVQALQEANPMLGQRGCRLGIVYPEIYDMQIEAIFRAAAVCIDGNVEVKPELMIPLVGHANELKVLREHIELVAEQVLGKERLRACPYKVGTMIEVPRAALTADEIAPHADFFSFGTNDLTQMTFGYSRDDAEGKFLAHYVERKLLPDNPFQVLDEKGVGQLIELAVTKGKSIQSSLQTGICGEHGGDKASIAFCHRAGLDYVSCSPYRIPLARIAAAQAAIEQQG